MNLSVPATYQLDANGAPAIWGKSVGPPPTYSGYAGANVIVGIVSSGLDFAHLDFVGLSGTSRVLFLWQQDGLGSPQPSGYTYGVERTQAQLTSSPTEFGDSEGSGTHLAGVAAASGRATGGSYPAYRYIGMAPQADLIIVKTIGTGGSRDYAVLDAVRYIFGKATTAGKPCVVVVTTARQHGSHDGGATLDGTTGQGYGIERTINNIGWELSELNNQGTLAGRLIVAPAGDYGQIASHAQMNLPGPGSFDEFQLVIPSYAPSQGEYVFTEAWHDPGLLFQARMTSPTGIQTSWVSPGGDSGSIQTIDGTIQVKNDILSNSKGAKQIKFTISANASGKPKVGTWHLEVTRMSGSTGGLLHAWVADWGLGSGLVSPSFANHVDHNYKVANPSWGDGVISVGGYYTRNQWTNFLGQISAYLDNPTVGAIDSQSSWGPRRDSVFAPQLAAPCVAIASCSSAFAGQAGNLRTDDGVHVILRRKAVAAAHVAGALACLLGKNSALTSDHARAMLTEAAVSDPFTGSVPNNAWGHGKLHVTPATEYNAGVITMGGGARFPEGDGDQVPH